MRDYERIELTQQRAEAFIKAATTNHLCVNCGEIFQPIEAMGQRECLLHSEQANAVDASSYVALARATRNDNGSKAGYHPCCGRSDAESSRYRHLSMSPTTKMVNGCCAADHVSHDIWRMLDDVRANTTITARVLDTDDVPASQRTSMSAVAARLHILPVKYALLLFEIREGWKIAWRKKSPIAPRQSSSMSRDEKIKTIMGKNCLIIDQQHALTTDNPFVTIPSGSLNIRVNLRDAYLAMCFDFSIPLETIRSEDVLMTDASVVEETDTTYIMRRQALYAPEGEADDGSHLPSSLGGRDDNSKIIDYGRPDAFIPFVICSWIDPYVKSDSSIPW